MSLHQLCEEPVAMDWLGTKQTVFSFRASNSLDTQMLRSVVRTDGMAARIDKQHQLLMSNL